MTSPPPTTAWATKGTEDDLTAQERQEEDHPLRGCSPPSSIRRCGECEDPAGPAGERITRLHKTWLGETWKEYTAGAHKALAEGYVTDARFTAYYDRNVPGCARFLCDAVRHWAK